MRNTLAILTAICVGSALVGCSKNAAQPAPVTNKKPNPIDNNQNAITWNVRLDSNCGESVEPDQCAAKYGFSVQLTDGLYTVGPGPTGETRSAKLTEEELNTLKLHLGSDMSAAGLGTENHATIEAIEGGDTISLAQGSSSANAIVKTSGTDLTHKLQSQEQAQALLKAMKALAERYYQLPFPDSCMDQVESVRNLMATVQSCTTNADCTYVDIDNSPLDLPAATYVTTDDCKLIRPLAVANLGLLKSSQDKILGAYNQLANACGDRFTRDNCSVSGFEPNGAASVCEQGVCKIGTPASSSRPSLH